MTDRTFLKEVHDTVKACQHGNSLLCYQKITENAEKIVAFHRAQQAHLRESHFQDFDEMRGGLSSFHNPTSFHNPSTFHPVTDGRAYTIYYSEFD